MAKKDKNIKFIGKIINGIVMKMLSVAYVELYMIYSGNNYGKSGIGYSILK